MFRIVFSVCASLTIYPHKGVSKENDLLPENDPPAVPDYITSTIDDLNIAGNSYN